MRADFRRAADEVERRLADQRRQQDETDARREPNHQSANEHGDEFRTVACPKRLGGEAAGGHAQEAETPEDEGEDERTDRDGTNVIGFLQLADDGGVDDADQGLRDVGEHDRHRNGQDRTMRHPGLRVEGHAPVLLLPAPQVKLRHP